MNNSFENTDNTAQTNCDEAVLPVNEIQPPDTDTANQSVSSESPEQSTEVLTTQEKNETIAFLSSEERQKLGDFISEIIDAYIKKSSENPPPKLLSGASGAFVPMPPQKPKTIDEANRLAVSLLNQAEK